MMQASKDVSGLNAVPGELSDEIRALREAVYDALCDDLNTSVAIAHLFDAVRIVNQVKEGSNKISLQDKEVLNSLFKEIAEGVLGLADDQASGGNSKVLSEVVELILEMRREAKAEKNFARSDEIRERLTSLGITIKDTKEGTEWTL
jgi:cysteinyl-tRNA synthetase